MAIPPIRSYPLPGHADLPPRTLDWGLDPDRAVLLVHDMQVYFTRPFADPEPLATVVANIARLRAAAAAAGLPVVFTRQPGGQTPAERGLLQDVWGPGLPADPALAAVLPELAPGPDDVVLTKRRYSAFLGTDLAERLRAGGRDQMIVTGIYGHIGVLTTAIEAFSRDIAPFLVADGFADFTAREHADTVRHVAGRCGAVLLAADAIANLTRVAA
ncbi:hypothetical protein GCM10010123_37600 [Pilimelia anulata]|uniref:Isochorismatase-like domain-containing protein n=1 Tax=Pilimelia anulata TaxID=53371 RepID=A0A8J3FDF9_9ACTN|nr:isochorismatase family protein [Pilimelia anulata]GGK04136.1 hypothetical protein GCM10010123_37600 [Pilimelia anulata]